MLALFASVLPTAAFAKDEALWEVYRARADLHDAFDPDGGRAIPGSPAAGFMVNFDDWARQYGWRDYPALAAYAPASPKVPMRRDGVDEPVVDAVSFMVVDRSSGQVLSVKNPQAQHPIASLTKLVTAMVVLDRGVTPEMRGAILSQDDAEGAKLYVNPGEQFTADDLFFATLTASANNAANALSRLTALDRAAFVAEMNRKASSLGLSRTYLVDPTGLDPLNGSTAAEVVKIAQAAFARPEIRRYTTTAKVTIAMLTSGGTKLLTNTNRMLYESAYDDVYVTGGKTGYLEESAWNLAVTLRPSAKDVDRELLIVVFGAASRNDSFKDAQALARWAWNGHEWKPNLKH
jgi:D-alanyl-D-alanine endopeptidase (penicillin-binding protein 7)